MLKKNLINHHLSKVCKRKHQRDCWQKIHNHLFGTKHVSQQTQGGNEVKGYVQLLPIYPQTGG